jgi:hypothetical protein
MTSPDAGFSAASRYALDKTRRLLQLVQIATLEQQITEAAIGDAHKDFEDHI